MNRHKKQKIPGELVDVLIQPAVKKIERSEFLKYRDFICEGEKALLPRIGAIWEHAIGPTPPVGEIKQEIMDSIFNLLRK